MSRKKSVVSRVLELYEATKDFVPNKVSDRPRLITMRDKRATRCYLLSFPQKKENRNTEVSRFAVSYRLKEFRLKSRSPATKPIIIYRKCEQEFHLTKLM